MSHLQEYDFEIFGSISATDIDEHVAMPRGVDDRMVVLLVGEQCDGRAHLYGSAQRETNGDERCDDVTGSNSRCKIFIDQSPSAQSCDRFF